MTTERRNGVQPLERRVEKRVQVSIESGELKLTSNGVDDY